MYNNIRLKKISSILNSFEKIQENAISGSAFSTRQLVLAFISDLIIPGLATDGTAKICCRGLILSLFYSTIVIKNDFG